MSGHEDGIAVKLSSSSASGRETEIENTAKERVRTILEDGRDVSVDKIRPNRLPEWFDEELFCRGQKYFFANFHSMFLSKLIGLVLVLTVPTILDVLILTNKSSDPYTAFRRYRDTIYHMIRWYTYDVKIIKSKSQKSVTIVHGLHCAASRVSHNSGLGLRVSQKDMVLTQFGFMGLLLLKKKELAIVGDEVDEMSIVHFWRTIGYLLGIQDKYNLCQGTLEEVRSACDIILKDVYVPGLKKPPTEFNRMVKALIDGLKPISPTLDTDAFIAYLYEVCGIFDLKPQMVTLFSRWMYNLLKFVQNVLLTKKWLAVIFRPYLNYSLRFSVWVNITFPFGAALKFGTKVFHKEQDHHSYNNNLQK